MASIIIAGNTSGAITLASPAVSGSNTLTLPSSTDTLVGKATTDTLTNKTLTSPTISAPVLSGSVTGTYTMAGTPTMGASILTSATAQNSTSGTSIDFTGIPSWAKRITVMFNGVSLNGTSSYLVQLGSGSIDATSYVSTSVTADSAGGTAGVSSVTGLVYFGGSAAYAQNGLMVIANISGNIWISNHAGNLSTGNIVVGGGSKSLSGALDRVRITTVNGTDTFDAGSINILYE